MKDPHKRNQNMNDDKFTEEMDRIKGAQGPGLVAALAELKKAGASKEIISIFEMYFGPDERLLDEFFHRGAYRALQLVFNRVMEIQEPEEMPANSGSYAAMGDLIFTAIKLEELHAIEYIRGPGRDQNPGLASIAQVGVPIGKEVTYKNDI